MTVIWKECPKSIKIKASSKPTIKGSLSGVVLYTDTATFSSFNISYQGNTEKILARYMPMGSGPAHPTYLTVVYFCDVYRVWCSYLNEDFSICLWQQKTKPEWCSIEPEPTE